MKNILIIGANGFTGRRMLTDFSQHTHLYTVTGVSLKEDICSGPTHQFMQADIRNEEEVDSLFEKTSPDIVINTAALSVPDYCESHHQEADEVNIKAVEYIARNCEKYGSKLIHLSTDFVFDGNTDKLYNEEDKPNPVNYYGITKWKSEQVVESVCSKYAVVRVEVVYGEPLPGQHGNIVQLIANKLRAGETIRVASDQWRTPTFVGDISQGIEKLFTYSGNGIFHICGGECLSIAEIAYRVAAYLNLDNSLIHPVTTHEMQEATPRPRFSGLSIEKAGHELGYRPRTLEEGMLYLK